MVIEKREAGEDNRRPWQREAPEDEDISDEDNDADEGGDYDTDEEELDIPDDPRMVARIVALRNEKQALEAKAKDEEHIRTLVLGTVEQWKTSVDIIQSEVIRLRALIKERKGDIGAGGGGSGTCKPQEGNHGPRKDDDEDDTSKSQGQEIE